MTVKLIVLKSGEDIIADMKEMVVGEGDDKKVIGYFLNRACGVSLSNEILKSDDVEIDEVTFTNGLLTVRLNKIVPDHQKRKVYEITGS